MDMIIGNSQIPIKKVTVNDNFWNKLMEITRKKVIPYQWKALNDQIPDAPPSYCIRNFKIAAGLEKGEYGGKVFQDSDVAKWIEAVSYTLMWRPDSELESLADNVIDLIAKVQLPDGYLNTYYIINGIEDRWTNVMRNHELYCAGHMLEAAIAYYNATGKDKLLNVMIRYVDHICDVFGPEEGKLHAYPGHPEIELALMKLYSITGNKKHLNLAKYFIDERGKYPLYFEQELKKRNEKFHLADTPFKFQYYQAGKPLREQNAAEGHAVRAVYLYSGMVDVARETQDEELFNVCKRIWSNLVNRRMYITGSIGSSRCGEAFSFDYDLPNDMIYGETCAAVGLIFFAYRMLLTEIKSEYADVMERVLYNGSISGMSLDGTRFFYVNPLEVHPFACENNYQLMHVKPERQKWFGTACCPPNLARLIASLPGYIYTKRDNSIFMHLYVGGKVEFDISSSKAVLDVHTNYPWDGKVRIEVEKGAGEPFDIALRIPWWCRNYTVKLNSKTINVGVENNGYVYINKNWIEGDVLELNLDMPVELVYANPNVRENIGKVAVMRGPVVYCLEEADNGKDLHRIAISDQSDFKYRYEPDLLGGVVTLTCDGFEISVESWNEECLYMMNAKKEYKERTLKWIPYYTWANRGVGEMRVWIHER